jgi:hypothetical protein
MELSKRSQKIVDELIELLENEHIHGCDQSTCDINVAFNNGFGCWALYLFDSCGAASDEFTALYAKLPKSFYNYARKEADQMCDEVSHADCPHCNAVVWELEQHGKTINCDSCVNDFDCETGLDIDEGP